MRTSFLNRAPFPSHPFFSIARLVYLATCTLIGLYAGVTYSTLGWLGLAFGSTAGLVIGCLALWIETQLTACSRPAMFGGTLGVMIGMSGIGLVILAQHSGLLGTSSFSPWSIALCILLFPYLGLTLGLHFSDTVLHTTGQEASAHISRHNSLPHTSTYASAKVLDSSAIIDGRIIPLCTTGFLEGPLLIPELILREIHLIADSDDASKRVKGKRGLEILADLQQLSHPEIMIVDDHHSQDLAVDHQLIAIAKDRNAKIVTNDWNLAKIAIVQGVQSLNVNELTYHLRPLVLPGERIRVFVQKEGQGFGQGIAHLDDGTMVVIDHGATAIGRTVEVEVTRFMQTTTGRMIFASPKTHAPSFSPNRSSHSQHASLSMPLEPAGRTHQ